MTIKQIAYHRNGVSGEGFYAVIFTDEGQDFIASVFKTPGQVSVFKINLLETVGVEFGKNSWRGDYYETSLRKALDEYAKNRYGSDCGAWD